MQILYLMPGTAEEISYDTSNNLNNENIKVFEDNRLEN